MVEIDNGWEEPLVAETMLEALNEARIFECCGKDGDRFEIQEACDRHFRVYLTREQLHQLADELKALADT